MMSDEIKILASNDDSPKYVVGIGASAGGLEALEEFFGHLPTNTDACFIVLQHLSPDFKSMMPELLSKHTSMPIYQVSDGFTLEKNAIYLMPARTSMLIDNKVLKLSNQNPYRHLHMPIDIFFNSLAHDLKHKSVGIILSGTGSDGTRGIKTLKELDGLTIVQDPESAKFDGMPKSAFNTGLIDLVLRPEEMGPYLERFFTHPHDKTHAFLNKSDCNETETKLDEIFSLLKNQSSINFANYKSTTVARRIERRLTITQTNSLDDYLRVLMRNPKEIQTLCRELLINVTRFFRDDDAFSDLTKNIIPNIVKKALANDENIRVWIAACSTGEEAYSIAILLDEEIQRRGANCKVKIFATDVDTDAIAAASVGVFAREITSDVSQERLEKYFYARENTFEITQHIRQMVIFASHNMIDDAPFSNLHLVSCRNVLIYFQHAAQKKVLSSLYFSLQRDGYLFLGSSESLGDIKNQYDVENEKHKIFRKNTNLRVPIGSARPIRDLMPISRHGGASIMTPMSSALKNDRVSAKSPLASVIDRLIKSYAPDCIVLNDMFDAVHVYGEINAYMKGVVAGRISNNIKDMIIDELSVAISTALYRCEKNGADVYYKDISVSQDNGTEISIDLSILHVKENDLPTANAYYVVQFIQQGEATEIAPKRISYDINEQSRQRIQDLEQELMKKQEHLQVTIEELETTNEELQSTNEELMSANEEMQSTNEELQSVNEELYTVNSEYQEKISLLTETNNDLDGVINATDIGIIFLDDNLCIRKFTPTSANFVNLRDTDIGRPFHHISHQLYYDTLLNDVSRVSESGIVVEKEIISERKQNLFIRICPYKKPSNASALGVLITITNITRLRFIEGALENAQDEIRRSYVEENSIAPELKAKKILLVDDNYADIVHIERMLKVIPSFNLHILQAENINEAIKIAEHHKNIDICICDYNLSDGSAIDVYNAFKNHHVMMPFILVSGFSEEGLDNQFISNHADDFLNKDDISPQLIEKSIRFVLEKNKQKESKKTYTIESEVESEVESKIEEK